MRLKEKEKKGGSSKSACACQNLSPGQRGEQGPHRSPATGTAPWENTTNQICVI